MHIVNCPQCGGKLRVPQLSEARQVRCGHCQHSFQLEPADVVIDTLPGLADLDASLVEVTRCPACRGKIRIPRVETKTLVACGHCNQSILLDAPDTIVDAVILEPQAAPASSTAPTYTAPGGVSEVLPWVALLLGMAATALGLSTTNEMMQVNDWSSWVDVTFSWDFFHMVLGGFFLSFILVGIPALIIGKILVGLFHSFEDRIWATCWGMIFGLTLGIPLSPAVAWAANGSQWHMAMGSSIREQFSSSAGGEEETVVSATSAEKPAASPGAQSTAAPANAKASAEKISGQLRELVKICDADMDRMERYRGNHLGYERATPGSYVCFGFLVQLHAEGLPVNSETTKAIVAENLHAANPSHCSTWDADLAGKNLPGDTCQNMDRLSTRLLELEAIHQSHIGKRNIYERKYFTELGVYDPSYLHPAIAELTSGTAPARSPAPQPPSNAAADEGVTTAPGQSTSNLSPPVDARPQQWQSLIAETQLRDANECGRMPQYPRAGATDREVASVNSRAAAWVDCLNGVISDNASRVSGLIKQLNGSGCCDANTKAVFDQLVNRAASIKDNIHSLVKELDRNTEDFNREQEAYIAREQASSYYEDSYSPTSTEPSYEIPPDIPGSIKSGAW